VRGSAARYALLRGERPRRTPPAGVETGGTVVSADTDGSVVSADTGGNANLGEP